MQEYEQRLARHENELAAIDRNEATISWLRVGTFVVALVAAWQAWVRSSIPGFIGFIPIAFFIALIIWHERLIRRRKRSQRAVAMYRLAIARRDDKWHGRGPTGARFASAEHPYSGDLDLFGDASLFQLLSVARTAAGEAVLAEWLTTPATAHEATGRQEAVDELRSAHDLRERISLAGDDVREEIEPDALVRWAAERIDTRPWRARAVRILSLIAIPVVILALATAVAKIVELTAPPLANDIYRIAPFLRNGLAPLLVLIPIEIFVTLPMRRFTAHSLAGLEKSGDALAIVGSVLEIIEGQTFRSARLQRLRAALDSAGEPPSKRIRRLRRLVEQLDSARNQFFMLIAPFLLWHQRIAVEVMEWRGQSGAQVATWIRSIGELEALLSLAAFAHDHPSATFPKFAEGKPRFHARNLRHPLLAAVSAVPNDVQLGGEGPELLIVSGSNMSGKSTLLRTIGTNTVLAQAGGVVCGDDVILSPLAIGASITINDSLAAGKSRFYAEITRLREIVGLASSGRPLLFLLDEILHGTNSHDRRIGAEAIIRSLLEAGAIGLVTTHDLALAEMASTLGGRGENVHFEDHLENGQMVFDYKMKKGTVTKSNAIALMRAVGLEV